MNVVRDLLRRSVGYYADEVAVNADGRLVTYAEQWDRGLRLANGLAELGARPGDRIAFLEDNCLNAVDSYVGMSIANLARVPLYTRNRIESHAKMLNNTETKILVVDDNYAEVVEGIEKLVPTLEHVFVRGHDYADWLAAQSDVDPDPRIDPADPFIVRHTGGTTGDPNAIAYSNELWMATAREWFYIFPPAEHGDSLLHVGPLSHGSGYQLIPVWAAGGIQIVQRKFDPADCLETMEKERVAYVLLPPAAMSMAVRTPGAADRDWSALKVVLSGTAPIAEDTLKRAREIFGDVLYNLYGSSEICPVIGMGPKDWFAEVQGGNPLRATGKPLPWVDIEIRDADNRPLPSGEVGEIAARGAGQMEGYINAPKDTAERVVDGWILTGDIGYIDRHGYVYLLDRKSDLIVSGGFNVYPAELENVLCDHPDVIEAAVFGIPDERWGESPMAVCKVTLDATVEAQELIDLVGERLGSYKKPARVELTAEDLPRGGAGKIQRKTLREKYWDSAGAARVSGS